MGRNIRELVLAQLKSGGSLSAHQLSTDLSVSRQYVHRVLAELYRDKSIIKYGSPPRVTYQLNAESTIGNRGTVLWLTGPIGSGKTTLGRMIRSSLLAKDVPAHTLDADYLDEFLNSDLSTSSKDQSEAVRRTAEAAKILIDAGVAAILSPAAPFASDRNKARNRIGRHSFIEVSLECPHDIGIQRSLHGGNAGIASSIAYEPPQQPDLRVDTTKTKAECLALILDLLSQRTGATPGRP